MEQKDYSAGFLSGLLEMKQDGLIDHVIELYVATVIGKATPAGVKSFVKDIVRKVRYGDFCFSSVMGMTLKRIGRYLKATHLRGLILNSSSTLKLD